MSMRGDYSDEQFKRAKAALQADEDFTEGHAGEDLYDLSAEHVARLVLDAVYMPEPAVPVPTSYGHITPTVAEAQEVQRGQIIGHTGGTGAVHMAPEQGGATEEQIEAALDAWFSHEDEGIIDWLGTGSRYPTQDEQRRDLRPILTAVISAVAALTVDKRTEEQIEAAARMLHAVEHDGCTRDDCVSWIELTEKEREEYRKQVRVVGVPPACIADERHGDEAREADAARALIVAIAEELTPGRRDKDLVIAARELRLKVERCEAESEDHAATTTGEHEKLLAEAETWSREQLPPSPWGESHIVHRLIAALRGEER